jgi:cytidine deaminase
MVAGLKQRLHAAGSPAAHHTQMSAMFTGHHFDNGAGFTMTTCAENYAFIMPFHRRQFDC